jgi:hypothetical protein
MNFDLRFPIGLLFSIFGLVLTTFGFLSDAELYKKSLDINVNLLWGLVLLAFGAAMFALAWRARSRDQEKPGSRHRS